MPAKPSPAIIAALSGERRLSMAARLVMASSKGSGATFTGGSGQMAVMAELLHRKCNAAIPRVDVGTDLFAFRDEREDVARIQVKTARARQYKDGQGYNAKFGVPMVQLRRLDNPPLFYALAVRLDNGWATFVVISRAELKALWDQGCGSENSKSGDWNCTFSFGPTERRPRSQQAVITQSAQRGIQSAAENSTSVVTSTLGIFCHR